MFMLYFKVGYRISPGQHSTHLSDLFGFSGEPRVFAGFVQAVA